MSNVDTYYYPITAGRDFSGVICAVGCAVKDFRPGMEVMGVVPPPFSGSHTQYVVTSYRNLAVKPKNQSYAEAAAIPYAGLTAWSALNITGELCFGARNKLVLVSGASGGVGTMAVQLLKLWGASVFLSNRHLQFSLWHVYVKSVSGNFYMCN